MRYIESIFKVMPYYFARSWRKLHYPEFKSNLYAYVVLEIPLGFKTHVDVLGENNRSCSYHFFVQSYQASVF